MALYVIWWREFDKCIFIDLIIKFAFVSRVEFKINLKIKSFKTIFLRRMNKESAVKRARGNW